MATTTSSSSAQACGDPRAGAVRAGGKLGDARAGTPSLSRSLPADVGTVLKVVSVPKESWHRMEPLLLEELQVFQVRGGLCTPLVGTPRHPLVLPVLWVVPGHSSCRDVGAGSPDARVPPHALMPARTLPAGCRPHHQPAALLQAGKGGAGRSLCPTMALPGPVPWHGSAQLRSLCCPPSNSSMPARPQRWPSCPCTAAAPTAKPVPSAAWPGTRTAPGTAAPAPATCPTPRGG